MKNLITTLILLATINSSLMARPVNRMLVGQSHIACQRQYERVQGFTQAIDFIKNYQAERAIEGFFTFAFTELRIEMTREKMKMLRQVDYLGCWWNW